MGFALGHTVLAPSGRNGIEEILLENPSCDRDAKTPECE